MIRIDLICGYLGAGKTTYLNRLLSRADDMSGLAVMVNDFGEVNLDAALISAAHPGVEPVPFANGCVCCSVTDDFTQQLEQLAALGTIDRILLEASGVASPNKLKARCSYPGFEPGEALTLVDAASFDTKRHDKYVGYLLDQQVAEADRVEVTKLDLNPDFAPAFECAPVADSITQPEFATLRWSPAQSPLSQAALLEIAPLWERVKGIVRISGARYLVQGSPSGLSVETTALEETGLVFITSPARLADLRDALDRL